MYTCLPFFNRFNKVCHTLDYRDTWLWLNLLKFWYLGRWTLWILNIHDDRVWPLVIQSWYLRSAESDVIIIIKADTDVEVLNTTSISLRYQNFYSRILSCRILDPSIAWIDINLGRNLVERIKIIQSTYLTVHQGWKMQRWVERNKMR